MSAAPEGRRLGWIAPQKMMLGARPQPVKQLELRAVLIKVGIAITGEAAVTFADGEYRIGGRTGTRNLHRPYVGLVIAQALMLGGIFGARLDRHAGLGR